MTVQGHADDDFEAAAAVVLGLPVDHPDRAGRAADLIADLVGRPRVPLPALRRLAELLAAAARRPTQSAQWPRIEFVARVQALMYAVSEGPSAAFGVVEEKLRSAVAEAGADPAMRALVESAQMALAVRRAVEQGDESYLQRLPGLAQEWMSSMPDHPGLAGLREVLSIGADSLAAHRRGDSAAAWAKFARLAEAVEALPSDSPYQETLRRTAAPAAALRSLLGADGTLPLDGVSAEQLAAFRALADRDDAGSGLADAGLAAILLADSTLDLDRIDEGIARLRGSLDRLPSWDLQRGMYLQGIALGLFRRSEATGTTDGLDEARELLIEARTQLAGPQDPQWPLVNGILAGIDQRLGDNSSLSASVLDSQRGHAWRVILETDTAGARIAIRSAAESAVDGARQCISTGNLSEALRLLDSGRGLLLFAEMEQHRIPARLAAAGRPDLAVQWKPGSKPSEEARRQALEVLTRQAAGELFDPPRLARIQGALALLDADALVYLVPGEPPLSGLAVMAPAEGQPAFMALPSLTIGKGTDAERYLTALCVRSAREVDREISSPREADKFAARLADLCDWAWGAAMGPVLESYLPRLTIPAGRVPRIVLIPMGDLARVPWHAARRKDGAYAVELAAISQAVSARLMCDNAVLAPVAISSTGLVVGDPQTESGVRPLRSARVEAHEIRKAFYRGARYLGRLPGEDRISPSGSGTAEQIRDWLVNRSPAAGSMLHLACHGFFKPDPEAVAYLLLGDGSELNVDELVDLLATAPDREIALVVLAACNSGRTVYGYDEAYSLGTGFLAGGVRSVLSTQWSVPDAATSWLMYLFHHYVRDGGMPPWQALRQAQMWMLDPGRTPPPGMPAGLIPGPGDHPESPVNWAGFVHYGQ